MKSALFALSLFAGAAAHADATVDQFAVHCTGHVQIASTFNPHFDKGLPPRGRFPGHPASAGFSAVVNLVTTESGCRALDEQYKLGLFKAPLQVSVSVAPVDLAVTEAAARSAVGKIVPFHFEQAIHYSKDNTLPLYPYLFEESLWLESDSGLSLAKSFEVDSFVAHGIPSLKQMNDGQKLALAKKAVELALEAVKERGWYVPYTSLLASIEVNGSVAKVELLKTLVSLFESLNPNRTGGIAFFDFNVGGSDGRAMAERIIALINETGAFGAEKIESLAFQFPALLLLGTPVGPTERVGCLPISSKGILNVLSHWEGEAKLNYQQKYNASRVAGTISDIAPVFAWCMDEAKAEPVISAKAASVYEKLKN